MPDGGLFDLLDLQGIRLGKLTPGHNERLRCPRCGGGKSQERSLSVTVDDDGLGAAWRCHRGHCGWQDGVHERRGDGERPRSAPRDTGPPQRPAAHAPSDQDRPEAMYGWFAARGIGRETVDAFGCYRTPKRFRDGDAWVEKPALVFPYRFRGELVNRKFRSAEKDLMQDPRPLPTLFNIDAVESPDLVVWVEGETDVMALHEAGYPQAVSLKDGAPAELREEADPRRQDDKRFAALGTHGEWLNGVQRFILAGDTDQPGRNLREELARRLGRHRCWLADWPEGCKDACDTLRQHGAEAVQRCIEAAVPYPMKGMQRIGPGDLLELRRRGRPPVLTTGAHGTDQILHLPGEGRVIVVTGIPNHGKSSWVMFVKMHLLREHHRRFVVFSPEMEPWQDYVAQSAGVLYRKPFWPTPGYEAMTDEEVGEAEDWLNPRIAMLVADPEEEDQAPTLEWIIERARLAVLQTGATDLLIDPWNELEHRRGDLSETDYIGRSLQKLRAFARRHGCNVWIIAHPTKQFPAKPGEKLEPPNLYSISGSANWNNKADLGLTVHTVDGTTQIHVTKSRFQRWGRRGDVAELDFEVGTGCYMDTLATVVAPGGR